jgi:hypothetical protein
VRVNRDITVHLDPQDQPLICVHSPDMGVSLMVGVQSGDDVRLHFTTAHLPRLIELVQALKIQAAVAAFTEAERAA